LIPGGAAAVETLSNSPEVPALDVRGLSKRFGDVRAVEKLSLRVRPGEVFGLLGPNGAGKSTTINLICGLLAADAGDILLFGEPVHPGAEVVKRRLGVCPQEIVIWSKLTCLEQLEFTGAMYGLERAAARRRGLELLSDLGLLEKKSRLAATLSGGMKRRLNLALALVHDPDFVVLDEPEAGLDPQRRVMVREYIRSLARRRTVLFTTHNMDEAERVCDRVAIIDRGALLVLDTPDRLKQTVVRESAPRENTLEDVFITLTGRRLRE
jgi:ABC-2 type transport system ATP-binding protein